MRLASWDGKVSEALFRFAETRVPRRAWVVLEYSGHGLVWIPLALACWPAMGYDTAERRFWMLLNVTFWLDLICIATLKAMVRRPRPLYTHQQDMYVVAEVDRYSFPSGHASRVWEIACVVKLWYPSWTTYVLLWATCTSCSRVALGRHYLGDVLVGSLMGAALAASLTAKLETIGMLDAWTSEMLEQTKTSWLAWID